MYLPLFSERHETFFLKHGSIAATHRKTASLGKTENHK